MVFSQEKVKELLKELEDKRHATAKTKDLDAFAALHHPHVVIVQKMQDGIKTFFGHEGVKECVKPFLTASADVPNFFNTKYAESTSDGEYLIWKGTYQLGSTDAKEHPFEVIYRKYNEEYLIYHDEFGYFP